MAASGQQRFDEITRLCLDCVRLCELCANECIDAGRKDLAMCIKLCGACADSCVLCIKCMSSDLSQYKQACTLAADLCEACAAECEKGQGDLMRQCAEACRKCAQACRQAA